MIATTDLPPAWGGIQRVVHELGVRLSERWQVTVVAPHDSNADEYDSSVPFEVVRARAPWDEAPRRCVVQMGRIVASRPAALCVSAHANALPAVVAGHPRVPRVGIFHGSELWAPASRLVVRALGRTLTRAIAVSRFTASEAAAAGIPADRIVVTPLAASPPARAADDAAILARLGLARSGRVPPYLLTISRLVEPEKGQDVIMRALPRVLVAEPEARYVIAGDGPLEGRLRKIARAAGVERAVVFTGAVDEQTKGALLRRCAAYTMVSRASRSSGQFEGFGITYLEAAFAGRPSLAGWAGGVPDVVVDGDTGLLVDPENVDDVAAAAARFVSDRSLANRLGKAALRRAEASFTWDAAVSRIEAVLLAALDDGPWSRCR